MGNKMENKERIITESMIENYKIYLLGEEKSESTIEKYLRNVRKLMLYVNGKELTKNLLIDYKESLMKGGNYKVSSINSMLIDINQFLEYQGWYEFRVKTYKVQKVLFCPDCRYLSKEEYKRLLKEAKEKRKLRLYFLLQTLAATGMRVSELQFLTVNGVVQAASFICCTEKNL